MIVLWKGWDLIQGSYYIIHVTPVVKVTSVWSMEWVGGCVWGGVGRGGVFVPPSSLIFKIALGVMTALIANPKGRSDVSTCTGHWTLVFLHLPQLTCGAHEVLFNVCKRQ